MTSLLRTGIARRSRTFLVPVVLLVFCLVAIRFTAFRTFVRLTSGPDGLVLTVNGRMIRSAVTLGPFREIRIDALNSVFPMGGERLTVRQGERVILDDRLPRRFRVKRDRYAPLGDWSLDPFSGGGTVYDRVVAIPRNFTLSATFTGRCLDYTSIVLVGERTLYAQFRRGLLNNDFVLNAGGQVVAVSGLVSPSLQMAANALDILLRGVIAGCILVLLFRVGRLLADLRAPGAPAFLRRTWTRVKPHWPVLVASGLGLVALGLRIWTAGRVLERLPHTPDEVAYMLQAKWILANRIFEAAPPISEYLAVPFTFVREGKWFAMYPIGWPLLLSLGELVGLPWIVGPLCGAAYVFVLFLVGKELYGRGVGLLAAALASFSPIAILMSSSFLSHAPTALMIAVFLWLYLLARRRRRFWIAVASGAALGFAFSIRPVTALAAAVPFAFVILRELAPRTGRSEALPRLAGFVVGGLIGAAPVFVSNYLLTGDALQFAYAYGPNVAFSKENLPLGLMYLDATAASVLPAVFGWGWGTLSGWPILSLTLAFACVPFLTGQARAVEAFFAAFLITLPLSFLAWGYHGLHGYGPRFYFESFLGLYLLTSWGLFLLAGVGERNGETRSLRPKAFAVAAFGLLAVLMASAVLTLPARLRLYQGYNGVSGSLERAIADAGIRKALVLFPDDAWFPWGAASNLLSADLRSDVVFAVSRPDNSKLFSFYADRPAYRWVGERLVAEPPPGGTPARAPAEPSAPPGRVTTLLAWWVGVSAFGIALLVGTAKAYRGALALPTPATLPGAPPRRVRREVPPEDRTDTIAGSAVRDVVARPVLAGAGVVTAYLGQILLTPGRLVHSGALSTLSEGQRFHAGWVLLLLGAVLFGCAWRPAPVTPKTPAPEERS